MTSLSNLWGTNSDPYGVMQYLSPEVRSQVQANPTLFRESMEWDQGIADKWRTNNYGAGGRSEYTNTGDGMGSSLGELLARISPSSNANNYIPLTGRLASNEGAWAEGYKDTFRNAVWDKDFGLLMPAGPLQNYKKADPTDPNIIGPLLVGGLLGGGLAGLYGTGATAATSTAVPAAASSGATGLSTLPQAGTWAQTALPALGEGAGSWTLPASLSGVSGATGAGGLTLGNALSNGYQGWTGEGITTNVPEGAYNPIGGEGPGWQPNVSNGSSSIPSVPTSVPKGNSGTNSNSMGNILQNAGSSLLNNFSNNPSNWLGALASLYGAYQNNQNKQDLSGLANSLMEKSDPFASQRGQYQEKLAQTYSDPMAIYNTPEYQGLSDLYRKKIEAKDAASGRRSQYSGRELEMQGNFLNYLNNYRQGLVPLTGANINPNVGPSGAASTAAIGQGSNTANDIIGALGMLFPGMPTMNSKINRGDGSSSGTSNNGYIP